MTTQQKTELQEVLSQAVRTHEKDLTRWAFFKVHNHNIGKDLVQDTFMKTWFYMIKGGEIKTMRAFLYRVLNDLIIDNYRKRKATSLDSLIENGFEPSTDESERLFNILDGKSLILLFKNLPRTYSRIMSMKYTQDLSLQEMSTITGQSKNTIAVQAHRGLEKLRVLAHA